MPILPLDQTDSIVVVYAEAEYPVVDKEELPKLPANAPILNSLPVVLASVELVKISILVMPIFLTVAPCNCENNPKSAFTEVPPEFLILSPSIT